MQESRDGFVGILTEGYDARQGVYVCLAKTCYAYSSSASSECMMAPGVSGRHAYIGSMAGRAD